MARINKPARKQPGPREADCVGWGCILSSERVDKAGGKSNGMGMKVTVNFAIRLHRMKYVLSVLRERIPQLHELICSQLLRWISFQF